MLIQSLNTAPWKFRQTGTSTWHRATVPGCVHSDLLASKLIPDPFYGTNELDLQWIGHADWQYTATFTPTPEILRQTHIILHAEGLDTLAKVTLNNKLLGTAENMFHPHSWNIKPLLKSGENTLTIHFASAEKYIPKTRTSHNPPEFNDPVGRCTVIRKQQCQFGWDWGPRFVTAGIWRPIQIQAWTLNHLSHLHVAQKHTKNNVTLTLTPELANKTPVQLTATLTLGNSTIATKTITTGTSTKPLTLQVKNPQLWWPNGHGQQPLYTLTTQLHSTSGQLLQTRTQRIGLRTITLDRHRDQWGESFQFLVNNRPIFAKGANWIPAHAFTANLTRADYERDLTAAAAAHMNMVRVWGGGIYEHESFYDLCDELGLLVWQDFMFACSLYPFDKPFLASVQAEAEHQVRRLHHRASLALWCGNNELAQLNSTQLSDKKTRQGYEALFHKLLPSTITKHDGATSYWPSSEWRGEFAPPPAYKPADPRLTYSEVYPIHLGEKSGDTHYWEVWHRRMPVTDYTKWHFRFCSEFGMQSYSSLPTQNTFCPPDAANIFGPVMENHQKNRAGNQIILDYASRRYRFPKDQAGLIYLSQLNQAATLQYAIEHFRRIAPRCMGTLYWQLNDCWPVASWSSIEFTGAWKALHYAAKRFFAPQLLSVHLPEDETVTIGNYRKTGSGETQLHTHNDTHAPVNATLTWQLRTITTNQLLDQGKKSARLAPNTSTLQKTLHYKKHLAKHSPDNLYLRATITTPNGSSTDTTFYAPPRFLPLEKTKTQITATRKAPGTFTLKLVSKKLQHRFYFNLGAAPFTASDNFFDLYPNEPKLITIKTAPTLTKTQLLQHLAYLSLADASA